MADDKLNEGSEEENKSNQSDEDFGLPDLEFDELQELDFNLDDSDEEETQNEETTLPEPEGIDMSVLDEIDVPESSEESDGLQPGDLDPPEGSVLDEGIDEVEDVLDSAQLISDRLGDDDEEDPLSPDFSADINYDDLMGESSDSLAEDESSSIEDLGLDLSSDHSDDNDDLLANIDSPDQLAALGILDEEDESSDAGTESGSDDDFGADSGGSSLFAADSADDDGSIFATDSMSFEDEKPDFEESDTPSLPPNYKPYSYEESSGGFAKVIIIGVLIISVIGGAFYYFSLSDGPKEVAKKEVPRKRVKKPAAKKPEAKQEASADNVEQKPAPIEKKPAITQTKPKAAMAQPGEIVRVTERSSRSYVIIGSFIDEDLAMDYATKLSGQGSGVKIIHPYGKSKRFRVSIADYSSYGDAASQLNSFKGQYGDEVWALQY
ncbi:Sporulation related domain-containing protein [Reichenbachiella faecimaris]|uniref:Sporulation related domain-containing protein n=1 Tax=Reichenbachiella faecimaris TaxID=692418 RepID=A0A1W2GNS3_REIFA|nr:SPOR domain-containing protein [Reichenbachiella faecimaris]SMD37916.1 Sporulation related domain-containing protein [Reichenbachiella faecimaris]